MSPIDGRASLTGPRYNVENEIPAQLFGKFPAELRSSVLLISGNGSSRLLPSSMSQSSKAIISLSAARR
jgi:hypothetical protein